MFTSGCAMARNYVFQVGYFSLYSLSREGLNHHLRPCFGERNVDSHAIHPRRQFSLVILQSYFGPMWIAVLIEAIG